MKCPKCSSDSTFRKSPHDLTIHCDRCHHSWQVKQVQAPIAQKTIRKTKGGLKGRHHIDVWLCPVDSTKYSFSLRYGPSFPLKMNEYDEDVYVKGCFDTPEAAIQGGIDEIYSWDEEDW